MIEITKELLDVRICDYCEISNNTETLREFIRNTEKEFGLTQAELELMSDKEFINYLDLLDDLWNK